MKTTLFLLAAMACAVLLFLAQCQADTAEARPAPANLTTQELVARGKYIMGMAACDDCHTPKTMTTQGPVPDMNRRFMGHPADEPFDGTGKKQLIDEQHVAIFSPGLTAFAGPWGLSYAANLTPDDTGTGNWTEAQFIKAIREGKSKGLDGTRPLMPPMPWPVYASMTDEDLKAVYAFLRTVKPIHNIVPNPKPL